MRIREYNKEEKIGDFVIVDGAISVDAIIANKQINKIDSYNSQL